MTEPTASLAERAEPAVPAPARARLHGRSLVWLAGATLVAGVNAWMAASVFQPIPGRNGRIAYVFVSASFAALGACLAAAAAAMAAAWWWLEARDPGRATARIGLVAWTVLTLVPLVNLDASVAGRIPALSYLLYDLRVGWWTLVVLGICGGVAWRMRAEPARRWMPGVALSLVVVTVAVLVTPELRFSSALHGDEPKYLRFCENFYQGLGFDLSAKRRITDPDVHGDVLGNARLVLRAVREEVPLLADDIGQWMRGSRPRSPRSGEPSADMFFAGKHPPSVYQLHNPGLSFLLFPAYVLDRSVTGGGIGYQAEFPARLPAVNVLLLGFYAAFVWSLYDLLRSCGCTQAIAWGVAAVASLALPAGAFPFQIYPEVPAAVIVALLLCRIARAPAASVALHDAAWGLAAGFLPWLHVRFSLVSAVLVAGMFLMARSRRRAGWWFAAGAAAGVAALCLYTYRLTGSLLPIATYGADAPLTLGRVLHGLPAFAFDRTYGLAPHAPVFLLALPGLVALWKANRSLAGLVTLLTIAIVLPAAGHGFWAGGGTPGRYLVAAVPMLALCLGTAVTAFGERRWFVASLTALTILSIETAIRYNLHHHKEVGPLVAPGFAGWRPNLLFPSMGTSWPLSRADLLLLVAWTLAAIALVAWGAAARRRESRTPVPWGPTLVGDAAVSLLLIALLALPVAALTGQTSAPAYLPSRSEARAAALTLFAHLPGCALCYASGFGAAEPTRALGNDPQLVDIRVVRPPIVSGQAFEIEIRPRTTTGDYQLGDVLVDFGDGTTVAYARHFGDLLVSHVFAAPGDYQVRASCGWRGRQADGQLVVRVAAPGSAQ